MKIIDKIKCLSEEKRRMVVLVILFFLALPLLFLVIRNFKTRLAVLQQTVKPEILPLSEITPQVSQSWDELEQAREDFNEQRELLEIWGGFGSSTMPSSAAEINFEGF